MAVSLRRDERSSDGGPKIPPRAKPAPLNKEVCALPAVRERLASLDGVAKEEEECADKENERDRFGEGRPSFPGGAAAIG